jgi:hypothetical protein
LQETGDLETLRHGIEPDHVLRKMGRSHQRKCDSPPKPSVSHR